MITGIVCACACQQENGWYRVGVISRGEYMLCFYTEEIEPLTTVQVTGNVITAIC